MRIQYFVGPVQQRQTGGQIYHAELMRFLSKENEIIDEAGIAEAFRGNMFTANLWCWKQMRRCHAEVIVEDSCYAACLFMSNWLTRRWGPRIIVFVQSVREDYTHSSLRGQAVRLITMNSLLRSATLVVANSNYTRHVILKSYSVPSSRIRVLSPAGQAFPYGIFCQTRRRNRIRKLLSVANIRPEKGQKVLLEAMYRLNRSDWYLTLVGLVMDQDYYKELMDLSTRYGLQERIRLVGFLQGNSLTLVYQESDIFVHPCLGEGYGMAVAEAISWGLPVVASRVRGIEEIVEDGLNCLLVPPNDPVALSQAIERLLIDDDLRLRLAEAAYARGQALPTWDDVGQKFQEMLRF